MGVALILRHPPPRTRKPPGTRVLVSVMDKSPSKASQASWEAAESAVGREKGRLHLSWLCYFLCNRCYRALGSDPAPARPGTSATKAGSPFCPRTNTKPQLRDRQEGNRGTHSALCKLSVELSFQRHLGSVGKALSLHTQSSPQPAPRGLCVPSNHCFPQVMKRMRYFHFKEGGKRTFSNVLHVFSLNTAQPVIMSDTDILNYSLFLLFISFFGVAFFFQRENSQQL